MGGDLCCQTLPSVSGCTVQHGGPRLCIGNIANAESRRSPSPALHPYSEEGDEYPLLRGASSTFPAPVGSSSSHLATAACTGAQAVEDWAINLHKRCKRVFSMLLCSTDGIYWFLCPAPYVQHAGVLHRGFNCLFGAQGDPPS